VTAWSKEAEDLQELPFSRTDIGSPKWVLRFFEWNGLAAKRKVILEMAVSQVEMGGVGGK
jgi:hypothetical protein